MVIPTWAFLFVLFIVLGFWFIRSNFWGIIKTIFAISFLPALIVGAALLTFLVVVVL